MSNEKSITLEEYNALMEKYDNAVKERDVFATQIETMKADIAKKDDKIRNLNDALYNSIITRQKPDDVKNDEPKSFDDLLREAFDKK